MLGFASGRRGRAQSWALGAVEEKRVAKRMTEHYRLGLLVGAKLRYLRQSHGLTPEATAADLNITVGDLLEIERGERIADAAVLHRVAKLFDCPLSTLFFWPREQHQAGELPVPSETAVRQNEPDLLGQSLKLVDSFTAIADPFMREEVLRITRFLARYSGSRVA